jgi:Xaa-Pro aminopeptidase
VIAQLLPSGVREIGIAPWSIFPAPVSLAIAKRAGNRLRDITQPLLRLRAVKSAAEVELLKKVAVVADQAAPVLLEAAGRECLSAKLLPRLNMRSAGRVRIH